MDCYFHPGVDGVVTCANCGVAMCRDCESNAFLRMGDGTGKALCNRCSLTTQQDYVTQLSAWLKKRMIKLIICSVLVLFGLVNILTGHIFVSKEILMGTLISWLIAGIVSNVGEEKVPKTFKEEVDEIRHPFVTFMSKIIGYIVAAPIFILFGLVGYLRTYFSYKKEVAFLNRIKSANSVGA